jgi:uncharacterized protein
MQVNVAQLLKEPLGSRRRYDFDGETDEGYVSCTADLMRTDVGILVTADCDADVTHTCGRCLQDFPGEAHFRFDEEFFPLVDIETGAHLTPPDDDRFTIDEHHTLDLTEAVRQYVILERPLTPVCREDCRGLCPQCGANLNERTCSCPKTVATPAWQKLREVWDAAQAGR